MESYIHSEDEKETDKARRFDDVFKTLLVVVTITMTFSLNFYKNVLDFIFFVNILILFVMSIVFWCTWHIIRGSWEYIMKLLAWHFLVFDMTSTFYILVVESSTLSVWVDFGVRVASLFAITIPTWRLFNWLKSMDAIDEEKPITRHFMLMILAYTGAEFLAIIEAGI